VLKKVNNNHKICIKKCAFLLKTQNLFTKYTWQC